MKAIVCDEEGCEEWVVARDEAEGWLFGVMFGGDGDKWSALGPYDFCGIEHTMSFRRAIFEESGLEAVGNRG